MPRFTRANYEQEVINRLPVDGSPIVYADLVDSLNVAGLAPAVIMLRSMKQRGLISMTVSAGASGVEHTVSRVQEG